MDILGSLGSGFAIALTPWNLFYAAVGAVLGTAVGVLPGLGPPATIAMLLPVTYRMDPVSAIIMLAGIFYGAQFGGSTTSILLNIPGEPTSVVTCMDGYQMARQGRAGPALGISAIGSFIGGVIGLLGLILIAPGLAALALKFGPSEYVGLIFLGFIMVVYLSEGSILRGLIMAALGLILGAMGLDPAFGVERLTFNITRLRGGVDFVVVCMGLFGIAEVLVNLESLEIPNIFKSPLKGVFPTLEDWKRCWAPILRSSILGTFIGVLPGGGAIVGTFAAYTVEKRISKHPERFGKGTIEGVAAPETANNASATSGFIPLMTLGIPGTASLAMIYVALMIHGIRPGPTLLEEHAQVFWGVVASMFIGNVILLGLNLPLIGLWVRLLNIPYRVLVLVIVVFCIIGAYSVNYTAFDVGIMIVFGVLGYLFRKGGFPIPPLILAMILGPKLERSLQQSLIATGGDPWGFFKRPITATLFLVAGLIIFSPVVRWLWSRRHARLLRVS